MIVGVSIVDLMGKFTLKGAGETHLRSISRKICCQIHIYEEDLEAIEWFEFEKGYKYGTSLHIQTLCLLTIRYVPFRLSVIRAFCYMSG